MNKDYLPYYDSLDDKYKEEYLNWSKETLIDHLVANIHNGEVLLNRIDKAIEFMEIFVDFDECLINGKSFQKAIDILKGEIK